MLVCSTWLQLYKWQAQRETDSGVGAGASAVNKTPKTVALLLLSFPSPSPTYSPSLSHDFRFVETNFFSKLSESPVLGGGRRLPAFNKWRAGKEFSKDAADSAKHLRHAAPVKCLTSKTCSTPPTPTHSPLHIVPHWQQSAQLQLLPASLRFLISSACQPFGRDKYI